MKTKNTLNPFCLAFGHNFFIKKEEDTNRTEVFCKSCKQQFRFSLNGKIIEIPIKQYTLFSTQNI